MALDPSSNGFAASLGNVADLADGALPIFDVEPVSLQFPIPADFVAAQVANNVLVLAFSTGLILRIDLNRPEDIDGRPTASAASLNTTNHLLNVLTEIL